MDMKTLLLTVGLPRSGKSSWARYQNNHPIVNPDAIRLAVHGQAFVPDAEPIVWAIAKYMVRALFLAGHNTVILDAANNTRKRREDWKSSSWLRKYKVFYTNKEECIRRAMSPSNNRPDLVPIIERMADQHEPVEDDEWDYLNDQPQGEKHASGTTPRNA
jgi:predicted kinase